MRLLRLEPLKCLLTEPTAGSGPSNEKRGEKYDEGLRDGSEEAAQMRDESLGTAIDNLRQRGDRLNDYERGLLEAYEGEQQRRAQSVAEAPREGEKQVDVLEDNMGNPIDDKGNLIVEEVASLDVISDEDFTNPTRSIGLPTLPKNVDSAIGANGRRVVIKKSIFEKNRNHHGELSPDESREILSNALYNPNLVGQSQPVKRPFYMVVVHTGDRNSIVVLDVYDSKENVEIVGWRKVDAKGLESLKKQAEREGGQFLILSPDEGSAAALSALPSGVSSIDKGNDFVAEKQGDGAKSSALERIPKDRKGKPQWDAVDSKTAWDGLVEAAGAEEDAADIAKAMALKAAKRVADIEKRGPEREVADLSKLDDPMEMAALKREVAERNKKAQEEYEAELEAARKEQKVWDDILAEREKGEEAVIEEAESAVAVEDSPARVEAEKADAPEAPATPEDKPADAPTEASKAEQPVEAPATPEDKPAEMAAEEVTPEDADDIDPVVEANKAAREAGMSKVLMDIADELDVKVVVQDFGEGHEGENGKWVAEERTIYVNSARRKLGDDFVLGHELNHAVRACFAKGGDRKKVEAFVKVCEAVMVRRKGGRMQYEHWLEGRRQAYIDHWMQTKGWSREEAEKQATREYIEEEMCGDALGEMLSDSRTSKEMLDVLSREEPGLLMRFKEAIRDAFRWIMARLGSDNSGKEYLTEMTNQFNNMVAEAFDISFPATIGDDVRHSVSGSIRGVGGKGEWEERERKRVYDLTKGLLEQTGVETIEVDGAMAQRMLGRVADDAQLMGSRTDRKMEKIAEMFAGKELDENQRKVVEVFSGNADNQSIEVERADGKIRIVMRQGDENRAGAKHSLFRHFETKSDYITAEETAIIPEIIAKGERKVNGKRISYDYEAEDGARLRVSTELNGDSEIFTNFYSNRKPLDTEGGVTMTTQLSAHNSDSEVTDANVARNAETDKREGEKPQFSIRTYHGTGADFDRFDFSYMGEGEGRQSFGWGGYVTEVGGIGKYYAEKISSLHTRIKFTFKGQVHYMDESRTWALFELLRFTCKNNIEKMRKEALKRKKFEAKLAKWSKDRGYENESAEEDEKAYSQILELLEDAEPTDIVRELVQPPRILYNVEIPDDNGSNYLDYDAVLPNEQLDRIAQELHRSGWENAGVEEREIPATYKGVGFDKFTRRWRSVTSDENEAVAAAYILQSMKEGATLESAMEACKEQYPKEYNYISKDDFVETHVESSENPYEFKRGDGRELVLSKGMKGSDLLWEMHRALGSEEAVSKLLSNAGFTGTKYPADYHRGGRPDGAKNYVVFREEDMKITDKVQWLKRPDGEVYGWTVGGKVYLNRDAMNPETPVHEYTHLWDGMVRKKNPELWQRGVKLMRQTPLWEEVKTDSNYADIAEDDDAIASEVHSRLTGKKGRELVEQMLRDAEREPDATKRAEKVGLVGRLKQWLADVFKDLKATLGMWSGKELEGLTADDFANLTLRDLADGVNPTDGFEGVGGDVRLSFSGRDTEKFDRMRERAEEHHGWVVPGLAEKSVKVVGVPMHDFTGSLGQARAQAEQWAYIHLVGPDKGFTFFDSDGNEWPYEISKTMIGKYVSDDAFAESDNPGVQLAVLKNLPEVIRESIEVEIHPDYVKTPEGRTTDRCNPKLLMHRLYGAVMIDGTLYRVKTLIKEYRDTNKEPKPYTYEVTKIELLETPFDGTQEGSGKHSAMASNSSISGAKLLQGVEKSYDSGKKVLDESEINARMSLSDELKAAVEHKVAMADSGIAGDVRYSFSGRDTEKFDRMRERAEEHHGWVVPRLAEKSVKVVGIGRHPFEGDNVFKKAFEWAKVNIVNTPDKESSKDKRKKVYTLTDSDGRECEYEISSNVVGKYLSGKANGKSGDIGAHIAVMMNLPEIIKESVEVEVHLDYPKRVASDKYNPYVLIHRLYGAVKIDDGAIYRVKTTIKEYRDGTKPRPYTFELTEIELLPEESSSMDGVQEASRQIDAGLPLALTKLLQGVEKSYDSGKKVLDESEINARMSLSDELKAAVEHKVAMADSGIAGDVRLSLEEDEYVLRYLQSLRPDEMVRTYRNVQVLEDGRIASPMAAVDKHTGRVRVVTPMMWERADVRDIQLTQEEQRLLGELRVSRA